MDLAHRTSHDCEVLGIQENHPVIYPAVAGDHPISPGSILFHAEIRTLVLGEHRHFDESAGVHQAIDPLPRGQLALGMLFIDLFGPPPNRASSSN